MGIEEHLQRIEADRVAAAASASREEEAAASRKTQANHQLRQLILQALPILRQRNHPRCLEINSVTVKNNSWSGHWKVSIDTGRTFTLLKPSCTWKDGIGYVVLDSGELFMASEIRFEERYPREAQWFHLAKKSPYNPERIRLAVDRHVRPVAERAGCAAVGILFTPISADAALPYSTEWNSRFGFSLDESGKLVCGDNYHSLDAEEWMAGLLTS